MPHILFCMVAARPATGAAAAATTRGSGLAGAPMHKLLTLIIFRIPLALPRHCKRKCSKLKVHVTGTLHEKNLYGIFYLLLFKTTKNLRIEFDLIH